MRRCLLIPVTLLLLVNTVNAELFDVTLKWDPPEVEDPNTIRGYELCYGYFSGQYEYCVETGNVDQYTITDLYNGTMYYFAARTLGWEDNKSEFSNEVYTAGYPLDPGEPIIVEPNGDSCFLIILSTERSKDGLRE